MPRCLDASLVSRKHGHYVRLCSVRSGGIAFSTPIPTFHISSRGYAYIRIDDSVVLHMVGFQNERRPVGP